MKKPFLVLCLFVITIISLSAQKYGELLESTISYVTPVPFTGPEKIVSGEMKGVPLSTELVRHYAQADVKGQQHTKYHQYYKDLRVLGGTAIFHSRSGMLYATSGQLLQVGEVATESTISEKEATKIAEQYVITRLSAEHHDYEDHIIIPKVVGVRKAIADINYPLYTGEYTLDLVYTVEAANVTVPFSMDVHIDAHTGNVIAAITNLEGVTIEGSGSGIYHENITFNVDSIAPDHYVLRDLTRGEGIYAYDISKDYAEITDEDNLWQYEFDGEKGALDGYYAAIKYYDFLQDNFGRNSIDGNGHPLTLNLNRNLYVNAFWNGSEATFGNGDCNRYRPLTTFEIVSHEFTHGLTDYTSDLVYAYESGALNESMSDIFGKGLEYFYDNDNFNWYIGQALGRTGAQQPFRSMVDPTERFDPKYYKGQHWVTGDFDNGGVHSNSGVLNHWFYLIVEGGSGTNEAGQSYNVNGIGMEDGMQLAYHMQANYLTELSGYFEARQYAEASAIDLYGANSQQLAAVQAAWDAVGVPTEAVTGGETISLSLGYQGRTGNGERYCPADFDALQVDVYNRDTDTPIPAGSSIGGTLTLSYDTGTDVITKEIALPNTTLTEELFVGTSVSFEIVEPLQGDPASVDVVANLAVVTPSDTYEYNGSSSIIFSTLQTVELGYSAIAHRDVCEDFGGIDYEYFSLDLPICEDLSTARILAIYEGELGTVTYEELLADAGESSIWLFNPSQDVDIWSVGDLSTVEFSLVYVNDGEETVLLQESYSESYARTISGEILYSFDDEDYIRVELGISGCSTCDVSYGSGELAISDGFNISRVEDCMSPKQYFDAVTNSAFTPASTVVLCVDLTDMQDPGLVFDITQVDNLEFTSEENNYIHITDVLIDGRSILSEPISSTGNAKIAKQIPLPAGYVGEIEIVTICQSTITVFDNLGIRAGVVSSSPKELASEVRYTNPVQGELSIYAEELMEVGAQISLYSTEGRLVSSQPLTRTVDVSALPAGLYFMTIASATEIHFTGRVVKVD